MRTQDRTPGTGSISRRTVAAGAAWAVPVVAVGAAAPAVAASSTAGLQGWILWKRTCFGTTTTLTVDGSGGGGGTYPATPYGFYVYNTPGATSDATCASALTNATVSWSYSPNYNDQITWTAQTGSGSKWSAPSYNTTTRQWTMTYTGGWTYRAAGGLNNGPYCVTNEVPIYVGTATNETCQARTIAITRCVTVNGTQTCFDRSTGRF